MFLEIVPNPNSDVKMENVYRDFLNVMVNFNVKINQMKKIVNHIASKMNFSVAIQKSVYFCKYSIFSNDFFLIIISSKDLNILRIIFLIVLSDLVKSNFLNYILTLEKVCLIYYYLIIIILLYHRRN